MKPLPAEALQSMKIEELCGIFISSAGGPEDGVYTLIYRFINMNFAALTWRIIRMLLEKSDLSVDLSPKDPSLGSGFA